MKRFFLNVSAVALAWLSWAVPVSASDSAPQGCCLTLPEYPDNGISLGLMPYYNYPNSYSLLTAQVYSGPIPLAPPAPLYAAWCVDANVDIGVSYNVFTPYSGFLYSSCDPDLNTKLGQGNSGVYHSPSVYVSPEVWKQVNYLLNHRDFTQPPYNQPSGISGFTFAYYWDVQEAINLFIGGPRTQHLDVVHSAVTNALVQAALANAAAWEPQCGKDKIAAVAYLDATPFVDPSDDPQLIILEVPCSRPPTIACPADVTVQCASSVPAPEPESVISSACGCPGPVTNTWIGDTLISSNCPNSFVISRAYQATDACGKFSICAQVITVDDKDAPLLVTVPPGGDLGCNPLSLPTAADVLAGVVASDNCAVILTNVTFVDVPSPCGVTRTFTITATDACGNTSDAGTVVYTWRQDTTPPTIVCPPNFTNAVTSSKSGSCGGSDTGSTVPTPDQSGTATATDNCDLPPVVTYSDQIIPVNCGTVVLRTWTAVDGCGNSSSCVQIISLGVTSSSICGKVVQDSTDCKTWSQTGVAGVVVTLKNSSGVVVGSTVTDAYGKYCFTDLPAGTYTVVVTPPANTKQTGDPDGKCDNQTTIVLVACQKYTCANFAYSNTTSCTTPGPCGVCVKPGCNNLCLTWTALSGAQCYNVKRSTTHGGPYTTIKTGVTSCGFTDSSLANGVAYYYVVSAVKDGSETADSAEVCGVPTNLPVPWNLRDIGNVGAAGGLGYDSGAGVFTVTGSGADIWGSSDEFAYAYQSAYGDCSIVARVTGVGNTNPWAKAGVTIRDSLSPYSAHASLFVTPGNGVAFQYRKSSGGTSGNVNNSTLSAPYWLKLVRSGSTLKAYASPNGSSWTLIGSQTIYLSSSITIGLAVTSHDDGELCTATFDKVTATP